MSFASPDQDQTGASGGRAGSCACGAGGCRCGGKGCECCGAARETHVSLGGGRAGEGAVSQPSGLPEGHVAVGSGPGHSY
jgi:hypothetical protein